MKKVFLVFSLFFLVLSVANANQFTDKSLLSVNKSDNEFLFDSPVNTISLNSEEMKNTEGEVWVNVAGAIVGGYVSGAGYLVGAQGNQSATGLEAAFVGGAIAGFISPVKSFSGVLATFAGGATSAYLGEEECCPW